MWRNVHFGGVVLRGPQVVGEGRTPEDALPRMLRILRSPSAGAPHPQESHERRTPEDALLRMLGILRSAPSSGDGWRKIARS